MHVILFGLGLILSSAGLAAIAFGYRDIEFTIGTTLISAGAIAGTGGLVLIGLAAVVQQLRLLRRAAGIQVPQPAREAELAELPVPGVGPQRPDADPGQNPIPPKADAGAAPRAGPARCARLQNIRTARSRAARGRADRRCGARSDLRRHAGAGWVGLPARAPD